MDLDATDVTSVRVAGVCPVLLTPFAARGDVDFDGFAAVVDHAVRSGVTSVMYPGFASEFYKLTDVEEERLIAVLLERTRATGVRPVVSIPDHATEIAVRRARAVVEAGAPMVNILPPHYLAPAADAIRAHVGAILDAIAPVPAILQYAPAQTGTALDAASIAELADRHPNLVQVKVESTPPGALISALRREAPALQSVVGYAGVQLPDAFRRGAVGVQPGSSFVELYCSVWSRYSSGDGVAATALHQRMLPYISYWMQSIEIIIAAEKLVAHRRGLISSSYCRSPSYPLDAGEITMVEQFLDEFASDLPVIAR